MAASYGTAQVDALHCPPPSPPTRALSLLEHVQVGGPVRAFTGLLFASRISSSDCIPVTPAAGSSTSLLFANMSFLTFVSLWWPTVFHQYWVHVSIDWCKMAALPERERERAEGP